MPQARTKTKEKVNFAAASFLHKNPVEDGGDFFSLCTYSPFISHEEEDDDDDATFGQDNGILSIIKSQFQF